ncbi:MAG: UvrD-helicase domain-containing protein [Bryobacteraceae bacterium]
MIPSVQTDDGAARDQIRGSLSESLIVEASAGTGKTSELIQRIVRVLAAGTKVQKIVAVTFTHKAAGELKIRLRQELDNARGAAEDSRERANLEDALERLEEAAIGTIHGFCAQILRERPVEAKIDPDFEELTQQEAGRFLDRAFDWWFQQKLDSGAEGLRRALARLAWPDPWQTGTPVEMLKTAARQLVDWRDHEKPWERIPFDREARIDDLVARCAALESLVKKCSRGTDVLVSALRPLLDLMNWLARASRAGRRDSDTIEARLLKLGRDLTRDKRTGRGNFAPDVSRQEVLDARDALLAAIAQFGADAGADLAVALRLDMQELVETYTERKQRAGKLDFLDLLLLVRNLVRNNQEVRRYLQDRFERIFVDEFQDTDPLQAEILILLSADNPQENDWLRVTPIPGKLFVVGDPKQSIYKFRRADVTLYENVCRNLEARGLRRIHLTKSYRAVRPIQQMVNAAFAPEMTGDVDAGQARYAPLEEYTPAPEGQPAVVVLPAPEPYGAQRVAKGRVNDCLSQVIAAYIDWLINKSGWKVRELGNNGSPVPLRARHICVLFRKMVDYKEDLCWPFTQALEARNIPHLLVGSKTFYHREEVETMRAALAAIEWPDDELSVFSTLRGSLFAIDDNLLLRFRLEAGRPNPLRRLPEDLPSDFVPIRDALAVLARLHRGRNWRPVADTIMDLLESTRAQAGFLLRRAGSQALANVNRLCDMARTFELTGGISFRGFVEELAAQSEKAESTEAPVLEEASDGVRLMTVHSAKGLEFPVVILADLTTHMSRRDPERFVDEGLCATRLLGVAPRELTANEPREQARELAEGVRVAYVAATRARDLLVIPALGDQEHDSWLSPLNKAIYPPRDRWREKIAADGCCPSFPGDRTVLTGPGGLPADAEGCVRPGSHSPQSGEHRVVWWDPIDLRLDVKPGYGLHQEDILLAEPAERAAAGIEQYKQWRLNRQQSVENAQAPSFRLVSPTGDIENPPERHAVRVESVAGRAPRPGGTRFGTLVHAIMRDMDLLGSPDQIDSLARVHGRMLRATEEERLAAVAAVGAAWVHPLLARARVSTQCHRELPIHLSLEDGRLLEGAVDLAFVEKDRWVVVDFKSDSGEVSRYERQMHWYLYALAKLSGRAVAGYLFKV